jgi:hypothetical protein
VETIIAMDPSVCPPPHVTLDQADRVVVLYIDGHPARLNEPFLRLAAEALKKAWPCR